MIPRRLHLCWLLDPWEQARSRYLQAWRGFAPLTLWHGGQLELDDVLTQDADALFPKGHLLHEAWCFERAVGCHAACADLLRYEVLYRYGGVYVDLDVLPKERAVEVFDRPGPVFTMSGPHRLETRFMAAAPHDPTIDEIRHEAARLEHAFIAAGGYRTELEVREVVLRTGPFMVSRLIQRKLKDETFLRAVKESTPENKVRFHRKWEHIVRANRGISQAGQLPQERGKHEPDQADPRPSAGRGGNQ